MGTSGKSPEDGRGLRQQAEEVARGQIPASPPATEPLSPTAAQKLLLELQVHQIELELQNEELRRAQLELGASQARYFDLYDLAPVGYLTLSWQGLILEANLTAAGLLGVSRGALVQQPVSRFLHADDKDLYYLQSKRLLSLREPLAFDLRMLRGDGVAFWGHLVTTVAPDPEGPEVLRLVLSDVTGPKQAEAETAKLQAQLQQAQKMESLGILAGGVAHDMNNVLGAILGLASAHLSTQPEGSPLHRALGTICKATERGGKMVKSLLSFARQTPAENHQLDLNALLREQVSLLERSTLANVHLLVDLEPELQPIRGDAGALTHVFMNLCVNAVDAMPQDGTLTLRTRNVDHDWIELLVEDTGTGMSKEVLEKALDPFFTTKEVGKGTGLGLSMVHSIVKAHRGQLSLQSEPGQGTRVRLRFPACEREAHLAAAAVADAAPIPHGSLKVLLVDDDDLIQGSVQMMLEVLGHREVFPAPSGEEALAMLEAGLEPDLVILDMNMPGLGGIGTLPRLRVLRPTVPVLLATGRIDQTALTLAAAHPGVTLLPKPFGVVELQNLLEKNRARAR